MVRTGTGDGGLTPGRKVKSFLWMVIGVLSCVLVTTKMKAPDQVSINALWIIGFGGLFTIGGQSLVDSLEKWQAPKQAANAPADPGDKQ